MDAAAAPTFWREHCLLSTLILVCVSYKYAAYNKSGIHDDQLHVVSPGNHTALPHTASTDTVQCDSCVAVSTESTYNANPAACSKA